MTDLSLARLDADGFLLVPEAVAEADLEPLLSELARLADQEGVRMRGAEAFAVRNVLDLLPSARLLVESPGFRCLVEPVLGADALAVKATLFDKTPDANWHVGWHQDLTIALPERRELPGFRSWSVKAGVPHVQPPAEVLERMLAVRLHLDPCGEENGALRVIPGSHGHGRLESEDIQRWIAGGTAVTVPSPRGGALLMRPLLLHASSRATAPAHRRVLHVEFARRGFPWV